MKQPCDTTFPARFPRAGLLCSTLLSSLLLTCLPAGNALAEDAFVDAITNGKLHLNLRYRFEHVDDEILRGGTTPLKDAKASTFRTFLGWETGEFYGFSATVDIENIVEVFSDDFNNGSNGNTRYATVVDPSGTEVDQSFLKYSGFPSTTMKLGRQYLYYRKAPFQRYIGIIPWRQNWQTYDAFTASNTYIKDTTVNYAYVWNVSRIFGEDATSPFDNFDHDSHLVNIQNTTLPFGKLEGYAYLLDINNALVFSSQTYGVRFSGKHPITDTFKGIYAAEYAHQSDYADNPGKIDADYALGDIGVQFKPGAVIDSLTLKFTYEYFEGNGGTDRFNTILGTNHAYQGWADRFLVTPGDGIEDYYFTAIAKILGAKFIACWHDLGSDNLDYDYGDELDLQLTKTFKKRYTVGLKYANYSADRDATSITRNGSESGVNRDVDKFWAWIQFKY